jgi:hypothetical protein
MQFLCFATGNKHSRVDKMSIYPLEQKVIKSNVLKKEKIVPKYATQNVFGHNRRFSRDMIHALFYPVRFQNIFLREFIYRQAVQKVK